ncbi:putative membrane protein [Porphyridium purpureum]|uniref:Glycerophosphocholine acyltransferase 1 n=1 Tax=Porphyridium purpureum TaxID=35688 RepID=A0A5J4YPT5_PORPP|nr:putative membrane protein [Porphyridium purpureum]|eukprot:POR1986..scf295_9
MESFVAEERAGEAHGECWDAQDAQDAQPVPSSSPVSEVKEGKREDSGSSGSNVLGQEDVSELESSMLHFSDLGLEQFEFDWDMQDVVKERMKESTGTTLRKVRTLMEQNRIRADRQRALVREQIAHRNRLIREAMGKEHFVMTVDKLTFVGSIALFMIIEFVLLCFPERVRTLYLTIIFPLLVTRYALYRSQKFQYFTYDFCYFAQCICIAQAFLAPDSPRLLAVNFAVTTGPLAFAVVVWKNSLVWHSLDKMTSVYIHILPPLVTFCLRWDKQIKTRAFFELQPLKPATSLFVDHFLLPLLAYIVWQALYLFKTEVFSRRKLENDPEIMTSLRWLTRNKKSATYKVINCFGEDKQLFAFVTFQCVYTALTLILPILLWHSILAHAAFLMFIFGVALLNGASYYFSVFATRYMSSVAARAERRSAAAAAAEVRHAAQDKETVD